MNCPCPVSSRRSSRRSIERPTKRVVSWSVISVPLWSGARLYVLPSLFGTCNDRLISLPEIFTTIATASIRSAGSEPDRTSGSRPARRGRLGRSVEARLPCRGSAFQVQHTMPVWLTCGQSWWQPTSDRLALTNPRRSVLVASTNRTISAERPASAADALP